MKGGAAGQWIPCVRKGGGRILCAIYTRLSKEDEERQGVESESIQNQKNLLVSYAREHGWEIYHIYCDENHSGADQTRPDFNRMLSEAEAGKFQIILCKSQSRFTRDMELVERYIHGLFPLWGIRFIAVADNADTQYRGNKKARQINGLINQWYLEDLSENIRLVLDMKRKRGEYIGAFPPYGYQKEPQNKNHLIPDPEAAEVVRQIFQWSLEGYGKQKIARLLNDRGIASPADHKGQRKGGEEGRWNKHTVWRILRSEVYLGNLVQGRRRKVSYKSRTVAAVPEPQWFRVEGTHEAIVDRVIFERVQEGLKLRARSDGYGVVHPLSGLVRCMDCGSTMCKTNNGKKGAERREYLRCKKYGESGTQKRCSSHSIRLDRLMELVSEKLRAYVRVHYRQELPKRSAGTGAIKRTLEREQRGLGARLTERNRALQTLYLDKVSGLLTEEEFMTLKGTLQEEKLRVERQLTRIAGELARCTSTGEEEESRAAERLRLEEIPRGLFLALVEKIEIGEQNEETGEQPVIVHWRF